MVAQALSDIEAEARVHRIQVDGRVPDCRVLGEPTLLTQLVRNLVQNAAGSIARSARDDQLAADLQDISGELVDGALHR